MTLTKKQKNGGEITGILLGVLVPCCDCADIFFIVLTTIKIILKVLQLETVHVGRLSKERLGKA